LERKKRLEISEPTPSADPLVSRVIGICVVVFRSIFDLGSRVSEFLSSLTARTLAWSATAAAVILMQAAVITALLVKEPPMSGAFTPGAGLAEAPVAAGALTTLSDEEIAALVAGGRQLMIAGDIRNARLVLQQAANADNAAAALELGATYDPIELEKLGVRDQTPDAAMARRWYQKAKELGSTEAAGRPEQFAGRDGGRR